MIAKMKHTAERTIQSLSSVIATLALGGLARAGRKMEGRNPRHSLSA